jgi:hypothetical protein
VPAMRESRTTIMIFFLSIIDLSFLTRGTMVPIGSMYQLRPCAALG